MVTKKRHIVGVKTKRAKKSKRKINKKRQTFKINKYIRAKRRSKKNLKLSRIQKNQLIGGGKFGNKGLAHPAPKLRPDLLLMIKRSSSPTKLIATLARMSDANDDFGRSNARRAVDSAADRLGDYRDLGGDLDTLPWRPERGRTGERDTRVRYEESLAHEERTRTVRDAAKEAAKKAFEKAERKETDWRVVEKAAEEAWRDHLLAFAEEVGDDEAAEKAVEAGRDHLSESEEDAFRELAKQVGDDEAAEKAVEEKRRAYIAVYIVTYELALKDKELGLTEKLKSNLRSKTSPSQEKVIETMGYKFDNDGNIIFTFGGKRKRRRTRRKKIKQEKKH